MQAWVSAALALLAIAASLAAFPTRAAGETLPIGASLWGLTYETIADMVGSAQWELGHASADLPGCDCDGMFEEFRQELNRTLATAPTPAEGPFGRWTDSMRLCKDYGEPLVLQVLGVPDFRSVLSQDLFLLQKGPCAAGVVTALSICAASYSHLARADAEAIGGRHLEERTSNEFISSRAMVDPEDWRQRLPMDCLVRKGCIAFLHCSLAVYAIGGCAHCLPGSTWPVEVDEIYSNVNKWTNQLLASNSPAVLPLPLPWVGPGPRERIRTGLPVEAIGAYVPHPALPRDVAGMTEKIVQLGKLWHQEALSQLGSSPKSAWDEQSQLPSASPSSPSSPSSSSSSSSSVLFSFEALKSVFTPLLSPWRGMRGPLAVRAKVHPGDFAGPRAGLKFFVYSLPSVAHGDVLVKMHGPERESVPMPATCDFGLSKCTELRPDGGSFAGYRPYAGEVAFLAKLLSAPKEVFVDDPNEATYFLVPFLSSTWCFLSASSCWVRCGGAKPLKSLMPFLRFYNASTAHRHIFLGSDSTGDFPVDLQMQPTILSYGPRACDGDGSGHIIMPAPVTDDLPLPSAAEYLYKDLFLFTADGVGDRPFRKEAIEELQRWQKQWPNLFVVARREAAGSKRTAIDWMHEMRRAVFCPVLPGDNTFRMRLFHAMLAGCIPVVIQFPGGGWYRDEGPSVERSMPFAVKSRSGAWVDWHRLAVELPHNPREETFDAWAKRLVPSLLALRSKSIQSRQRVLAEAAAILGWDFSGTRPDAFTALLDELRVRAELNEAPAGLHCFNPQYREDLRCRVSGQPSIAREESEIHGVLTCCTESASDRAKKLPAAVADSDCVVWDGQKKNCVVRTSHLKSKDQGATSYERELSVRRKQHNVNLLKAVFLGEAYPEAVPEDDICKR